MARPDHFEAKIDAIYETQRHWPPVSVVVVHLLTGRLASADKSPQMLRGRVRAGLSTLGCINPEEAYARAIDRDGISIHDSNLCNSWRGQEREEYEGTEHRRSTH